MVGDEAPSPRAAGGAGPPPHRLHLLAGGLRAVRQEGQRSLGSDTPENGTTGGTPGVQVPAQTSGSERLRACTPCMHLGHACTPSTHSGRALWALARGMHLGRAHTRGMHYVHSSRGCWPPGRRQRAFPQQEALCAHCFVELRALMGCRLRALPECPRRRGVA